MKNILLLKRGWSNLCLSYPSYENIFEQRFLCGFALPHYNRHVSHCCEALADSIVTFDVLLKFRNPEVAVPFRCGRILTTLMPVPETAVYKYWRIGFGEPNIRGTRHILHVGLKSNAQRT